MALLHNWLSGDEPPGYVGPNACACGRAIEADQQHCSAACLQREHEDVIRWLLAGSCGPSKEVA